jgi:hypothetical protein
LRSRVDAGSKARFLIRDRDSKFTTAFDTLVADACLKVITTGRYPGSTPAWSAGYRPADASSWTVP